MSFIDSQTVFTVQLHKEKAGGGISDEEEVGEFTNYKVANYNAAFHHGNLGFSHAGTSALNTFIIVKRRSTTPPPLSANPFLTIFTERHNHTKHAGFKYLGIMLKEYIIFPECTLPLFCRLYWTTARDVGSFSLAFSICTALSNVNRISLLASC